MTHPTSHSPSTPLQLAAKLARRSSDPISTKITAVSAASADDLPIEILLDILSRLPVKSLLRFRLVSKLWRYLIGDPSLVGLHFSRSLRNPLHHHFLITAYNVKKSQLTVLSTETHLGGGELACLFSFSNCRFHQTPFDRIKGLSLHPGEMFLHGEQFRYLINPSTRQILEIPLNNCSSDTNFCLYTLGCSRNREEFKVLSIGIPVFGFNPSDFECHVLTIGMGDLGEWKKVSSLMPIDIKNEFRYNRYQDCVCIAGVMHWILWKVNKIATFNLETESFSTMELPIELQAPGVGGRTFYLLNIDGCLTVVCDEDVQEDGSSRIDLWILKDYESEIWVKDIINLPCCLENIGATYLTGMIPYTGEIMLATQRHSADSAIVPLYDRSDRSFRVVEIALPPSLSSYAVNVGDAMVYTESLFSFRFLFISLD